MSASKMPRYPILSAEHNEMIRKIGEIDEDHELTVNSVLGLRVKTRYEILNDKKICILLERITTLEDRLEKSEGVKKEFLEMHESITRGFEKRIDELETNAFLQSTVIDYLREDALKSNDFQTTSHSCINTLFRTVGQIERKQELTNERLDGLQITISDCKSIQTTNSANIDCLCRVNGKRSEVYQKFREKTDALIREHTEDIIRLQSTIATYKQENEMLENRFHDLNAMNQSLENNLDVFRLKLIDISDETEKNTSEVAEIKRIATKVLYKNREYEQVFAMMLGRMDHIEEMKPKEHLVQRTCTYCGNSAETEYNGNDCCIDCHVAIISPCEY